MFKEFLRNNTAALVVLGISLAISFMIAGSMDDGFARVARGR